MRNPVAAFYPFLKNLYPLLRVDNNIFAEFQELPFMMEHIKNHYMINVEKFDMKHHI